MILTFGSILGIICVAMVVLATVSISPRFSSIQDSEFILTLYDTMKKNFHVREKEGGK